MAAGFGLTLLTGAAQAADLYDDPPPPRYSGPAYQDPRYADIDHYPDRPVPPARVYGAHRYAPYTPPPRRAYRGARLPRHVIRDRLIRDGWNDFVLAEFDGEVAQVSARRPSGRPFMLTVARCSGEIVDARPLRNAGPYASAPPPPPRRYDLPYYLGSARALGAASVLQSGPRFGEGLFVCRDTG